MNQGSSIARTPERADVRRAMFSSLIGNFIEWYDFFLYGAAAALIFDNLFFADVSEAAGTIAALATFAVGFAARPIGGIVFSHFGDKVGRRGVLVTTMLLMGTSTALIGFLPTYAAIGLWAPLLLVLCRIAQGIGVGGEWSGAALMVMEYGEDRRRGYLGGLTQSGISFGFVVAAGVFFLVQQLPEAAFMTWGWRIPFMASLVLVIVAVFIRTKLNETPVYEQYKAAKGNSMEKVPLRTALRTSWRNILIVLGTRMAENGGFYIIAVFMLSYAVKHFGLEPDNVLLAVVVAEAFEMFTMVVFGKISDKIGRQLVYGFGALFVLLYSFPMFWILAAGNGSLVFTLFALVPGLAIGHAALIGPQPAFFAELFGTGHRYSAVAFGHEIASTIAGGFSPVIAASLVLWFGGSYWPVSVFMILLCVMTIIALLCARGVKYGQPLEMIEDDATRHEEPMNLSRTNPRTSAGA